MDVWDSLTLSQKQKYMQEFISEGITDLDQIRAAVNKTDTLGENIDIDSPDLDEEDSFNLDYSNLQVPLGFKIPNYGGELVKDEYPELDFDLLAEQLESVDDDALKEYVDQVKALYKQKNLN